MGEAAAVGTERELVTDSNVITISFLSFITTFGVHIVSPTLPSIVAAFDVPETQIGLIMTMYTLPGILIVPITGVLADVYGRRAVLLPASLLTCLMGLSIAGADSFFTILVLRFGQGIVYAGIMPLLATMLGDLFTGSTGSTAQGIRLSANGFAMIMLPPLAGFLSGISWNYPFLLYVFGFPVVAVAYLTLPETGARTTGSRGIRTEVTEYLRSIKIVAANRTVLVLVAGGLFRGTGLYAVLTFLPLFAARDLGATAFVIGLVLAARGVVRIVVSPFTGRLLDVFSRRTSLLIGLTIIIGGVLLIGFSSSSLWLGIAFGLFGLGDSVFIPIHRDSVAALTTDTSRAGVLSGVSLLRKVGTTVAPVLFGIVLAITGFQILFVLVALVFTAYAIALVVFFTPT